jgi:uncharacterized protein (TIGR02284 family)
LRYLSNTLAGHESNMWRKKTMANAGTKDYVSTLNDLIETCKDGEEGFKKAAENVQRTDLKNVFQQFSLQRAQFAAELQQEVARIGGKPETSGSVSAAMHRGWIDVKGSVSGKDDHSVLEEAERGEDMAVNAYQEALGKDLPSDIRSLVESEYQLVQKAHNQIRSMRDHTGDAAGSGFDGPHMTRS